MKIFFRLYKGYYGHLILSSFLYIVGVTFYWIIPLITADKIAVMQNGTCVEYGTYDELMERQGEFYKYKMTQS